MTEVLGFVTNPTTELHRVCLVYWRMLVDPVAWCQRRLVHLLVVVPLVLLMVVQLPSPHIIQSYL